MNWELIITMSIAIAITGMSYKTYTEHKELKWKLKKLRDDYNIEFKGDDGSVSYEKKDFKEQKLNDDWRQIVGSENPHIEGYSIAKGMNDPSDIEKKAFKDYTDNMGYSSGITKSDKERRYWKNK